MAVSAFPGKQKIADKRDIVIKINGLAAMGTMGTWVDN